MGSFILSKVLNVQSQSIVKKIHYVTRKNVKTTRTSYVNAVKSVIGMNVTRTRQYMMMDVDAGTLKCGPFEISLAHFCTSAFIKD